MITIHQTAEYNGHAKLLGGNGGLTQLRGGVRDVLECRPDGPCQKVGRSIAYMEEHVNQPLQVSTLAALANVSSSHFYALFKQQMGCPPMDYFTRLRMRHACRLLDSTSARVKEVAAALGYDDPFYFSRVFKSVSAVAPVQYRSLCLASRREIMELLEPRDQMLSGGSLRRAEPGRVAAGGRTDKPCSLLKEKTTIDP